MKIFRCLYVTGIFVILVLSCTCQPGHAWDWLDYVAGGVEDDAIAINTLSLAEIGEMRVRDLRRRLTRTHGYSAEEVGRMLDKKELINTLAFEEHKVRENRAEKQKRFLLKRGLIAAVVAVVVVLCWPLFTHAWEVAAVNFVVYTDRKRLEAQRCYELQSIPGIIGVLLMLVVDGLQIWLTASILASWVVSRDSRYGQYMFPVPSLPIHPAQMMGGQIANGPLARYGVNVGPMLISWCLRLSNGTIESWTGKALSRAQQDMRKKKRETETEEEKAERKARKAARRAAKQAAKENAASQGIPRESPSPFACSAENPFAPRDKEKPAYETASVKAFLGEDYNTTDTSNENDHFDDHSPSAMDDLD